MIVVDNCILSSLSKIDRLDLLKRFSEICTTQSVLEEAMNSDMESIMGPVRNASKKWLEIRTVRNPEDLPEMRLKHPALSFVDCELIMLCVDNCGILLSDDTKMIEIAEKEFDLETFDLFELLLTFRKKEIIDTKGINEIISNLRKKDHYEFPKDKLKKLILK